MDGEGDREGVLLICDGGQLCEENFQRGQDGRGLTPVLIMGCLEMKSHPISAGGHSNSRLSHSRM